MLVEIFFSLHLIKGKYLPLTENFSENGGPVSCSRRQETSVKCEECGFKC